MAQSRYKKSKSNGLDMLINGKVSELVTVICSAARSDLSPARTTLPRTVGRFVLQLTLCDCNI